MKPIARRSSTLAETAYERIADALLTGTIEPGTRLVMDQLAEQLDISRTPVRDALLRLEQEGLIAPTGRRGYVVREISPLDIDRLYESREAVEGFAARRVAEIGEPAIAQVRRVVEGFAGVVMTDGREAYQANLEVHRAFVVATDNPILVDLFDEIWQRARGFAAFHDYLAHEQDSEPIAVAHAPLVVALESGADPAFSAMRDHIRAGRNVHAS